MTSNGAPVEVPDRQEAGLLSVPEEAFWEVPAPLSTCDVQLDERTVTTVRQHGNPLGPRLVLSHGNGLAIDPYYPFWSMLTDDFDLMVYDLRNHGRNEVGDQQDHNVPTLISDHDLILSAVVREYGEKPTVGVFHSFSALISLLSFSDAYSALVLYDPPLCKPTASEQEFISRRNEWRRRSGIGPCVSSQSSNFPNSSPSFPDSPELCQGCENSWHDTRFAGALTEKRMNSAVLANTRPRSRNS